MTTSTDDQARGHGRYVAFISYSHRDVKVARWLHRALERFRVPEIPNKPARDGAARLTSLRPVFLDREELSSSPDLAASVRAALQQSRFLIVVCSPGSARSRWVNEEVVSFQALGRADRILCLVVAGEPNATSRGFGGDLECLPPALRAGAPREAGGEGAAPEPLAADIRAGSDSRGDALLKIAAGLLGVDLDDLRRREQLRRTRRLALVSSAAVCGCIAFAGLAAAAWRARLEAEQQRNLAQQKSLTAERTSQFLVSLFKVSDPSESRGNTITARELLDRGARQVDDSLRNEPLVRADMLTTLGAVYQGLGLYDVSQRLLGDARAIPGQQPAARLQQAIALADLELQRGNAEASEALFRGAANGLQAAGPIDPNVQVHVLLGLAGALAKLDRTDEALKYSGDALEISRRHRLEEPEVESLEQVAMAKFYAGDMEGAGKAYQVALERRVALSGEDHPKAAESLNGIAATAAVRGDIDTAEAGFRRLAGIERRLLGPDHPEYAATLANLGRELLERRDFPQAQAALEESVRIKSRQQSANDSDFALVYSNLALAHKGQGHYRQARPLLERALAVAVASNHPVQGPILMYLADVDCHGHQAAHGLATLEEARPKIAARYPDDAWRLALADTVRAHCLATLGRLAAAERLTLENVPVVLQRWPARTIFGHDALADAVDLFQTSGNAARLSEYRQRLAAH